MFRDMPYACPLKLTSFVAARSLFLGRCYPNAGSAVKSTFEDFLCDPTSFPELLFPDYELSDHTAKRRKLSELQGQHPMILVLSRGGFTCPKDRRQAEGLVQLHRELEVAYCRLVTISTDNISETNEYRTGVGASLAFPLRLRARRPKRFGHRGIH